MFGRATIRLGIGPHSSLRLLLHSLLLHSLFFCLFRICVQLVYILSLNINRRCDMSETYGSLSDLLNK